MTGSIITCFVLTVMIIPLSFANLALAQYPDFFAGRAPAGQPLEGLAQEYWQWWIGAPRVFPKDPTTNLDKCYIGSNAGGQVVFLVNPYDVEYNSKCDIPADKNILVPLLVGECDPTVPELATKSGKIQDLWACATAADEPFDNWEVILDDVVIFKKSGSNMVNSDLKEDILVRNSPQFIIEIPENNSFEVPAGSYPAVVDGYYLPLKPLPPGEHTLEYKILHEQTVPGQLKKPVHGSAAYFLNVTE